MSSPNPTDERGWSLTRRMALRFAATSCALLLLYALWTAYFTYDNLRDDMKDFLDHETAETVASLGGVRGNRQEVRRVMSEMMVPDEHPCAFRVRADNGKVVATAGEKPLLARVPEAIPVGADWNERLFDAGVVVHARALPEGGTVELVAAPDEIYAAFREFAWFAFFAFLVSAALAGVSGWMTAHRGLKSLRDVVAQAAGVRVPVDASTIRLADAPVEVREVGIALNEMLERIHEGMRNMQTFTAGFAHELRSPLQNLIGETEVALLRERDAGEYRALLRSNLEEMQELSDAVDNLVAYCRTFDVAADPASAEAFDLAREVGLRLERERRSASRKDVTIDVTARGDTLLSADREGCLRVVRNLVGNAITWAPPGSAVEVTVEGGPGDVRLEVADRGPGVPAELGDRIFEPFVSGPAGEGTRGGYGLGLAICRSIVTRHGGTLRHEPRDGGGTRFVATLPRRPTADPLPA